jgi:predicted RNase H-like HicB family nuclease
MKFPIALHRDEGTDYGVIVPDFPGCHSWGETIEDAMANTLEAVELWVEGAIESGQRVDFKPSSIETLRANPDFADATWALVDVDPSKFDTKAERVNISLPRFVLHRIDEFADKHGETRSGFLARVALQSIAEEEHA